MLQFKGLVAPFALKSANHAACATQAGWCRILCRSFGAHQLVRNPLLASVVKSFKAWQLLVTRLRNAVACRGMVVESKEDVFDFEHLVAREPFAQFEAWFDEATKHEKVTTEGFEDELVFTPPIFRCANVKYQMSKMSTCQH